MATASRSAACFTTSGSKFIGITIAGHGHRKSSVAKTSGGVVKLMYEHCIQQDQLGKKWLGKNGKVTTEP